jgi:hypothetical protein
LLDCRKLPEIFNLAIISDGLQLFQPRLQFGNLQTAPFSGYPNAFPLAYYDSFSSGDDQNFLNAEVKTYLMSNNGANIAS